MASRQERRRLALLKRKLSLSGVALGEYLDTLLGERCGVCQLRVFPRDLQRHLIEGGECSKTQALRRRTDKKNKKG